MWYADIIAGITVFLLGIGTSVLAWQLPYTTESSPGPGFLPFWLGLIMAGSALFVLAATFRKKEGWGKFFVPETIKCLQILVLIVCVFLLLPIFGFSTGLALITGACMRLMGKHTWASCAVTVVVTAVCIHYLFGNWLNIPLPGGMIGW
jgi:putative tricarboxylic transport membrane protein